jgi:hypothetical protein
LENPSVVKRLHTRNNLIFSPKESGIVIYLKSWQKPWK